MDTAIWLWFKDRDPVAIHTLASAAHQDLDDLGREIGKGPILNAIFSNDELRQAYNIFKHASSDPYETTDFPPETNVRLLMDATNSFGQIYGSRTPMMSAFQAYVLVVLAADSPVVLNNFSPILFLPENVEVEDVRGLERVEFLRKLLPLFERSELL